ncbi:MAG: substrate-binding domain-containing protein [Phycisphaeraceae bacterium]|nr:substrate-binding domain-containing protein [Phycisphaeraceae bacterium]
MNIAEQRIPVSSIGLHIPGVKCDSVTFNLEHGIYETARYLIDMGHRRIGMVGTNYRYPVVYSQTILRSIQRAYSEHDLPYKERKVLLPVFVDEADPHWHNEILKLIQGDEPVTAMITSSDGLARYVGDILDNQGIQIPKDVSITGYDDLPFASKLSPPLTTISAPTERAGREAVRQVINRHMFPDRDPIQLMLDTSLIIRRSTVPPSTNTLSLKANT